MRYLILIFSTILISCPKDNDPHQLIRMEAGGITIRDTITTFILIRHAEDEEVGDNPSLIAEGQARALELKRMLSNVPLTAVFSTNYNRTMETAEPIATDQGLDVINYDPFNLDPFVDSNLVEYKGGTILVVGHSNTTPSLLNVLVGANTYSNLGESEFDNFYLVTVLEKGQSTVIHMKYGN